MIFSVEYINTYDGVIDVCFSDAGKRTDQRTWVVSLPEGKNPLINAPSVFLQMTETSREFYVKNDKLRGLLIGAAISSLISATEAQRNGVAA